MKKNSKIHFIGIGGIGVSALARYYLDQGWQVSGSDIEASEITRDLEKIGIAISIGSSVYKGEAPDKIVYSAAVKKNNPELAAARRLGIKPISYSQALGELTRKYETIAVAGAHGKSTATAMVALMMTAAGFDPTVIVGTKVREFGGSNFRAGKSKYLVIEACEYGRSFLDYWPAVIVITNIEMDHAECYENEAKLISAFKDFAGHLSASGTLIVCGDDKNALKAVLSLRKAPAAIELYSLAQDDAGKLRKIMKVPGEHNVANALAALAVGKTLGIKEKIIFSSLAKYRGSWRRFDVSPGSVGEKRIILVSDYGHHPTQIKLTMEAARAKWPEKKLVCVFQPHQAYRTHLLFKEFVKAFKTASFDKIFITDIYRVAGRELAGVTKKISSKRLVAAINKKTIEYVPRIAVMERLKAEIKGGEILLVMGAGDIYSLAKQIGEGRSG